MSDRKLLATGLTGSTIAAICCFTPTLVILLGAVGLSAWLAWADFALLPALVGSLGLIGYAALRLRRRAAGPPESCGDERGDRGVEQA